MIRLHANPERQHCLLLPVSRIRNRTDTNKFGKPDQIFIKFKSQIQIRKRIKVKSRFRIRIKVKSPEQWISTMKLLRVNIKPCRVSWSVVTDLQIRIHIKVKSRIRIGTKVLRFSAILLLVTRPQKIEFSTCRNLSRYSFYLGTVLVPVRYMHKNFENSKIFRRRKWIKKFRS
jgi:hypothetical protein